MHFHVVNVVMAISHDILSTAAPAARVGQHVIRAATVIRVRGRPPPSLPKFGNPRWLVKHLDTFWMAKFWDFGNIFGKNWKHTKSIISFCWFTTSTKQAQFCIVNAGTILAWSGLTDDWEIDSVCVFDLFRLKKTVDVGGTNRHVFVKAENHETSTGQHWRGMSNNNNNNSLWMKRRMGSNLDWSHHSTPELLNSSNFQTPNSTPS